MNSKLIMFVLNAIYLIATIIWAIIEQSTESFVAIVGAIVAFISFFVANDNSFSVKHKIVQSGDNAISVVGNVKGSHIGHATK